MWQFPDKFRLIAISVLVVVTALVYSNTLEAPFYFDDFPNIVRNRDVHLTHLSFEAMGNLLSGLEGFSKRPVAHASFALNYYFHQLDVTGYRVINLVIHVLAAIFLYLFIEITLKHFVFAPSVCFNTPSGHSESVASRASQFVGSFQAVQWCNPSVIAFIGTLLWLVHPVQVQSVTYVVQRMNSMSAMFYLLSLLLYVKARLTGFAWRRWIYSGGSVLAWSAAMGSKEIAITLPLFIIIYEWYFFQDLRVEWLRRFWPYLLAGIGILIGLGFFYFGNNPWTAIMSGYDKWDFTVTERVLTEFRVVVYYISLLVFPHPSRLNVNYDFVISHSLFQPVTTLFSLLCIASLLVLSVCLARKHRLFSFSILWFLGNLILESSVIPLDIAFEHRLYLPSMMLPMMVVFYLSSRLQKQRIVVPALSVIAVLMCLWTFQRNAVWADPAAFSQDSVEKSPESPRSHNWLGLSLAKEGEYGKAIAHYKKALRIDPDSAPTHNNMALALVERGDYDAALSHYRKALRIRSRYPRALYGMGIAYKRKGMPDKARKCFSRALRLNSNYAPALNQLGLLLVEERRFKEGIAHFSMALSSRREFVDARYNMAVAMMKMGALDEATREYQ
jgi:tetratricopeptide (TPR) repeat protein